MPGSPSREPGAAGDRQCQGRDRPYLAHTPRKSAQGGGKSVDNAVKAIAAGEKVDYTGAGSCCWIHDKGDILDCKFRYDQVKSGKFTLVKSPERRPPSVVQALVNGLVSGTLLAVPAIGFTAMFAVLRFFSVSGVATLGAFAGYLAWRGPADGLAGRGFCGWRAAGLAVRQAGAPAARARCRWSR